MKPEDEAILLANAIVAQDLAERGELVVSNHLVRMENSIRELSAEVNEAKKDYALLELKANEYEEGRDRNAELWERVKAERDRLAGENAKLREALEAAIKQLEHVETLRAMDWGPVPETRTPDVIADAKSALAQAGQELADALAAQRKEAE